ncbi:MAG TPA: flagellin [Acidimicrobiales bacterium]
MSGLQINYNAAAVDSYNNLDAANSALSQAVGELSSGMQIQSAADNPSGYVIGQYLQEEGNGYTQAISNTQSAVSVLQTAQGALGQEASILQTMNSLATEAANGGVQDATSQAAAQAQFASLSSELDQIASSTNYGGTALLDGTYTGVFQVGPYATTNDQISVTIAGSGSTALGLSTATIATTAGAQAAMTSVQTAIATAAGNAATVGATQNQITSLAANLTTAQQNIQAADANLVDVNVAQETSQFASDQILLQSGVSVLSQAQQLPSLASKLLQNM